MATGAPKVRSEDDYKILAANSAAAAAENKRAELMSLAKADDEANFLAGLSDPLVNGAGAHCHNPIQVGELHSSIDISYCVETEGSKGHGQVRTNKCLG